jgi:NAD(P)-dependent dehydrogenase (short-subunit alcohol dehydrogenase family)
VLVQIDGAVAFVTGANRGLGRRLTEQLLERGATVYAGARDPDSVTTPGAIPVRIDITDPDSVAAAAALAADVTLLVNNAGMPSGSSLLSGPIDDIRAVMESHFFGTLSVTRAFAPHLVANAPGAMLNVVSVVSWLHPGSLGAYAAAKTALWAQTDAVREELAPHDVAVTAVHIGFMDTDMTAGMTAVKTDPAVIAAQALDGVERRAVEVLTDDLTREAKAALCADRGVAQFPPVAAAPFGS